MTALPRLYVLMLRYRVAAMLWLFMLLGAARRGGLERLSLRELWAALTLASLYVAATTVNDLADAAIDRVNHPGDRGRPLVSGEASERQLWILHVLACALALLAAAPLGTAGLALAALSLAIGHQYSLRPLRLSYRTALAPLVLAVAYVLVPFALGVVAAGSSLRARDATFCAALFALFVARIVLKDFRDREGDSLYGRPTLLLRAGKGATCLVSLGGLLAANTLLLTSLRPPLLFALLLELFVVGICSQLHALRNAVEARREQVAIGIGARAGNGLLLVLLAWLTLAAHRAAPADRLAVAAALTTLFALAFATLAARPDEAVIGYKG